MSEQSQGPGWWMASDGRWYPPEQHPGLAPAFPPPGPAPSAGMSTGAKVALGIVGGFAALIALAIAAVTFLGTEAEDTFDAVGDEITTTTTGGRTTDSVPDPEVPSGYEMQSGEGVSLAVPSGWTVLDQDEIATGNLSELFPDVDPAFLDQATNAFAQGAVFFAADLQSFGFSSNISVARFPGRATRAMIEPQLRSSLAQLGGEVGELREVALPAGEALQVAYTGVVGGEGGISFEGVQLYVGVGSSTYVVTISAGSVDSELVDVVSQSFRGA